MHERAKVSPALSRRRTLWHLCIAGYAATLMAGTAFAQPAAPTGLTATPASESRIDLGWTDNASDETGFAIQHSPDGNDWTSAGTVGANVTSFAATGLAAARKHYFRVSATGGSGDSAWSNTADANTLDAENLARSGTGSPTSINDGDLSTSIGWYQNFPRSVSVTWAAAQTFNKVLFTIERVKNWELKDADGALIDSGTYNVAAKGTVVRLLATAATTTKLELVILGRSDGSGGAQNARVYELEAYQINGTPRPAMPSALTATAYSWDARIDLAWTDNATTESGYKVDASADGVSWRTIATLAANATAYQATGIEPGSTYYRVRAFNDGGDSNDSTIATATTYPPPNLAFTATGLSPLLNDGVFSTSIGWYDGFPRTVSLTWDTPVEFDRVVVTQGNVSGWDLKDADGEILATGSYSSSTKGTYVIALDPPAATDKLEFVVKGRVSAGGATYCYVYEIEVYAPLPGPPAGSVILLR